MKKIFLAIAVVSFLLVSCSPRIPVVCGEDVLKVPLKQAEQYRSACAPVVQPVPVVEKVQPVPVVEKVQPVVSDLSHLAYWTVATEKQNWPNMDQFTIVTGHSDPDEQGNAKLVILVGVGNNIQEKDLKLTYYNGYDGVLTDLTKSQIITEIQDSVRPHVPGFTLNNVEVIYLP